MHPTPRQTTSYTPWVPHDPKPDPKNLQPVINVKNRLLKNLWKSKSAGEKKWFHSCLPP
jgi:hypothetical protein